MLTFVKTSSSVLVMISSMAVPVCNHFLRTITCFTYGQNLSVLIYNFVVVIYTGNWGEKSQY